MNTILRTIQPRDWWNSIALGVVIVIAFLLIWMTGCSSVSTGSAKTNKAAAPASASAAVTTEENVPTALSNAGEYGENVYDYAKVNDWKNADVKLAALKDAVKNVRIDLKNPDVNDSAAVERL